MPGTAAAVGNYPGPEDRPRIDLVGAGHKVGPGHKVPGRAGHRERGRELHRRVEQRQF